MADGVAERFQRAAERMRQNGSLKLSNEDKLELYSLFKQVGFQQNELVLVQLSHDCTRHS